MSHQKVTISGGMPAPSSITFKHGKDVVFQSGDGQSYTIDFGGEDPTISSDQFPLAVPARGEAKLHIRGSAPLPAYQYIVRDSSGAQVWPAVDHATRDVPPQVIVD
ncbi:MAG: hypothetical protein ACE5IY_20890 [bacterium]